MKQNSDNTPIKATIRDVAKLAGTSIATVSYVLSGENRYLRPELRERVLVAARELGYVKNAAASSLKGKRRGIIAVLVAQFGNSFFTRMCVDIEAVARREGYIVTICNSDDDPQQERVILDRLLAQRIDGCIITPALSLGENIALLARHQVPFVILERLLPEPADPYAFVGHDNYQSGNLAAKTLLKAGHRNIAFLGWASPIPNVCDRVDGYRAALAEYGFPAERQQVLLDELSQEAGYRMAQQLNLAETTAVILGHHESAKGVLQYFLDKGVSWPEDISVVLIGTPEWAGLIRPGLTCIKRPEWEMGTAAAEALFEKLRDPDAVAKQQVFSCTVLPGESIQMI